MGITAAGLHRRPVEVEVTCWLPSPDAASEDASTCMPCPARSKRATSVLAVLAIDYIGGH